jgi:hypothetical protein
VREASESAAGLIRLRPSVRGDSTRSEVSGVATASPHHQQRGQGDLHDSWIVRGGVVGLRDQDAERGVVDALFDEASQAAGRIKGVRYFFGGELKGCGTFSGQLAVRGGSGDVPRFRGFPRPTLAMGVSNSAHGKAAAGSQDARSASSDRILVVASGMAS